MIPAKIQEYIDYVRSGKREMCLWQFQLVDLVEKAFMTEDIHLDDAQAARYMGLQKHFPYRLLLWEEFCFLLHNCVYKADGQLRWPRMAIVVGRGAGKNGYLAFEDFCLLTPVNGVKNYDIDIFATSEAQARMTFDDIWDILEGNKEYFSRYFTWTKEEIKNISTNSRLTYNTSSAKTKDGARPGKVDFDEFHAYENSRLVDVAVTGLGKKKHPRRTIITTMGDVRGGPMDKLVERAEMVLAGELSDGGWLYFICRLDSDDEIDMPEMWGKANPSLYDPNRPELLNEILEEYQEYREDPPGHTAFATKRMNRPKGDILTSVTSWENIQAASVPFSEEELYGCVAVGAIDYASTQDFVTAGVLIPKNGFFYWMQHTWVCAQSSTLSYVKFPLQEAEIRGELTIVDAVEIRPDIPVSWLAKQREKYNLILSGIDHFRFTLLSKAFGEYGFDTTRKTGNLKLTYTPEQSMVAPIIASAFINHKI
ncbi:MAG: terminase large subunit domain-containing protein, partial [Oscillospiraceae bacterium]